MSPWYSTPSRSAQRAHAIRRRVIEGLAALLVARVALALLPDSRAVLWFEQVTFLIPIALSVSASAIAARGTSGTERRFWTTLSVAISVTLVWESYVSGFILFVDPLGPPFPSWLQLVPLSAVGVFIMAVVSVSPFAHESVWARLRLYLDIVAALVLAFVGVFALIIMPVFSVLGPVPLGGLAAAAAYPVVGVAVLIATFAVFLPAPREGWRMWQRLMAGALSVYAVGLLTWPLWAFRLLQSRPSAPISGGFTELVLALGNYLFFAAAAFRMTAAPEASWREARLHAPVWDWVFAIYPVLLVALVPVLGVTGLSIAKGHIGTIALISAVLLSFVLVVRSWLMVSEVAYYQGRAGLDPLTGLPNELSAKVDMDRAWLEARRFGDPMSFAVLDIDDFSRVNDLEGHLAGDRLLVSVAKLLADEIGQSGRLYRLSGDEFGVLMPARSAQAAKHYVDRLAGVVMTKIDAPGLPCSVSGGVAESESGDPGVDVLVGRAVRALQVAKLRARGSVAIYDADAEVLDPEERLDRARKQSHAATLRALAAAVDARDPVSRNHSRNTARLARELSLELGLESDRVQAVELAALVHDVGQLALPDELLGRHAPVSQAEEARMREHVEFGERILNSTEMAEVRPWVRAHHERWDGAGYPDGMVGEQIPLEARIISVCDAFDAMTAGLHRERPLSIEDAVREIDLASGSEFDPDVAAALVRVISRRSTRRT